MSSKDVYNWADIVQCDKCLRGKPYPNVGSHSSYSKSYTSMPGQVLHADIVYIGGKPRLLLVDDYSNYSMIMELCNKGVDELCEQMKRVIGIYASHNYPVKVISTDYEMVLRLCEPWLLKQGVNMAFRIPGEHERVAERYMRVIRERIKCRLVDLKEKGIKLPKSLFDDLVISIIDKLNLTPCKAITPLTPVHVLKGDKTNFLTDIPHRLGSKTSESHQDIGFSVGRAPNCFGGIRVLIPGQNNNKPMT